MGERSAGVGRRGARWGTVVNDFSDVDRSRRTAELVEYLDHVDRALRAPGGPKERLRSHLVPAPGSRVLDLGCGAGHELVQLERDGMRAFGVDAVATMLAAGRNRLSALGYPVRRGPRRRPPPALRGPSRVGEPSDLPLPT